MLVLSKLVITIHIQSYQIFFKMITIILGKRLLLFAQGNNRFHNAKLLKPGYWYFPYDYNYCSLYNRVSSFGVKYKTQKIPGHVFNKLCEK